MTTSVQLLLFALEKRCNQCGALKPLEEFGPHKKNRDGHVGHCRVCNSLRSRASKARHADEIEMRRRRWYAEHRAERQLYNRQYYQAHREEEQAKSRAYYWAHREQRLAYGVRYAKLPLVQQRYRDRYRERYPKQTPEQRAARRAYLRIWYHGNPQITKMAMRRYVATPRGRAQRQESKWRRRARESAAAGTYTAHQWQALCAFYGDMCLGCGSTDPLAADHIVPLSRGGSNDIGNIQPLCRVCNSHKGLNSWDYRPRSI